MRGIPPLPWATLALAAALFAALLLVQLGFGPSLGSAHEELRAAVSFFVRSPMLEIHPRLLPVLQDEMPGYEGNELFDFMSRGERERAKQAELDALVERAFADLDAHPLRSLGVVPRAPHPWSYATHPLVHAGWLHGLATLLLLLLFGPPLERSWGRAPFAVFALAVSALAAGVFTLVHAGLDRPLVGASALAGALAAGVAVRFGRDELDLLAWAAPVSQLELRLPGWSCAAVWAAYEAALWWLVRSPGSGSIDSAVGYTAHAVGAASGGLAALVFARFGVEERFGDPPRAQPRSPAGAPMRRIDLERVRRLRAKGDLETAYRLLLEETDRSARHRDAVRLLWELALERESPEEAVPAMHRLIREELRRGADAAAVEHWRALSLRGVRPLLHPDLLLQLVPALRERGGEGELRAALEQVMDARVGLTPAIALEVSQLAADVSPELAAAAAEIAAQLRDLDEGERARLAALIERVRLQEEAPPEIPLPQDVPEDPFFAEQDRSAFGAVADDLTAPGEPGGAGGIPGSPARTLQVIEAVPTELAAEGLALVVSGRGPSRLDYRRIAAVAMAGVRGLGPKPVVLVDLVVHGPAAEESLRVVRLRSDGFDPRRLVPAAGAPLEALRAFALDLVKRARGRALTDPAAGSIEIYDSVEAYAAAVLHAAH